MPLDVWSCRGACADRDAPVTIPLCGPIWTLVEDSGQGKTRQTGFGRVGGALPQSGVLSTVQ